MLLSLDIPGSQADGEAPETDVHSSLPETKSVSDSLPAGSSLSTLKWFHMKDYINVHKFSVY